MNTVEEIKSALIDLTPDELRRFREWFEQIDDALWDRQFEEDVKAGRLDKAADRAIQGFRSS